MRKKILERYAILETGPDMESPRLLVGANRTLLKSLTTTEILTIELKAQTPSREYTVCEAFPAAEAFEEARQRNAHARFKIPRLVRRKGGTAAAPALGGVVAERVADADRSGVADRHAAYASMAGPAGTHPTDGLGVVPNTEALPNRKRLRRGAQAKAAD